MELFEMLITGGAVGAGAMILNNVIMWLLTRRAKKKDDQVGEAKTLRTALRVILQDRIRYLGRGYLRDGEIDVTDRGDLIEMHMIYHELGGNGNLKQVMEDVNKLKLKK